MRADKKQIIDEVWDEARIRSFLDKAPLGAGENPDFSALLYAYRSMRPEDFALFVNYFTAAGRQLDARSSRGVTLAETIAPHRHSGPFLDILTQHRASA